MVRVINLMRFQTLLVATVIMLVMVSSAPISSSASSETRVVVPPKIAQLIEFSFPSSAEQSTSSRQEGGTAEVVAYRLDEDGPRQFHRESRDPSGWRGSYGFGSPSGVFGAVEYTADDGGYRALVRSRQPNLVLWNDIRGTPVVGVQSVSDPES